MEQEVSLSPQVAHTVHMSALGLPGYHLHAAYAGDWHLSPTEVRAPHTWDPNAEDEEMCVFWGRMGRALPCFSGCLLNGRGEGGDTFVGDGWEVFCGSTRGRWVPLKKAYRLWIVAEWCHPLSSCLCSLVNRCSRRW